jgi:SAM-dependent methyltransferase
MFSKAYEDNFDRIRDHADVIPGPLKLLDLGSWDGESFSKYRPRDAFVCGIEYDFDAAKLSKLRDVRPVRSDLNSQFPIRGGAFDVVTSNQVIEHLSDTDNFVSEVFRVLRPGGMAIVSTENASSWHNIGALMMGWQSFSLTNVSNRAPGIGNPLAVLRGGEPASAGWEHLRIFSHRGLKELFEVHGFVDVHIDGAGYYPLPGALARKDPRHAAFITAVATKPT